MGGSSSKGDTKTENSGQVQNSISFNDTMQTYGSEVVVLLSVIVLIKIFEMFIFIYKGCRRNMKRELEKQNGA